MASEWLASPVDLQQPGPTWAPALLWDGDASSGEVTCRLCPHSCRLADGEVGICRMRANRGGVLETAALSVAVTHLDPIERKPFFHVRPGSQVLTLGVPGCTFRCNYCLNYGLSQYGRDASVPWSGTRVETADIAGFAASAARAGASLGLSYGEPGLALELSLALAAEAAPRAVPLVWKTNGFLTRAAVEVVAPVLDAVNVDVKAAAEAVHRRLTGAPLGPVFDTIERFRAAGVWVEVTTPVAPGVVGLDEIADIGRVLAAIDAAMPWHLARFTPEYRMSRHQPTAVATLRAARQAAMDTGVTYVYVERALGAEGRKTSCPRCGVGVVERDVWALGCSRLQAGACPACRAPIPGRWS